MLGSRVPYYAESDARHGSFDFRAAHAAAEADLQALLDNTESLPFRRRGYERDGMLRTLVEHAGMAQLYASSQQAAGALSGDMPREARMRDSSERMKCCSALTRCSMSPCTCGGHRGTEGGRRSISSGADAAWSHA